MVETDIESLAMVETDIVSQEMVETDMVSQASGGKDNGGDRH